MTRQEFLLELQKALTGQMSSCDIADHVEYYSQFIETSIRKGKTEEMVIDELGAPGLLARTLVTVSKNQNETGQEREHGSYWSFHILYLKIKNKVKEMWRQIG